MGGTNNQASCLSGQVCQCDIGEVNTEYTGGGNTANTGDGTGETGTIQLSDGISCSRYDSSLWQGGNYESDCQECTDDYETDYYYCSDGSSFQQTTYLDTVCSGGSCDCPPEGCNSPVIVDLLGHGYELTSAAAGVRFTLNPAQPTVQIAWTAAGSDNGFLVLDRNRNGSIDDGTELFGSVTPQPSTSLRNGFAALAMFDKPESGGNGNGVIDSGDAIFKSLRIWIDANHNGISEANELFPLNTFGIESISLDYKLDERRDRYGNRFRFRGKFSGHDPLTGAPFERTAYDVFLTTSEIVARAAREPVLALVDRATLTEGDSLPVEFRRRARPIRLRFNCVTLPAKIQTVPTGFSNR